MIMQSLQLFRTLPGALKVIWALLLVGMVMLALGYWRYNPIESYVGLGCLLLGYTCAILDLLLRKSRRQDACGFYVAITVVPLMAFFFTLIVAFLAALVLAYQSLIHGFSSSGAIHLLHFVGVVFAFLVVSGIPALSCRTFRKNGGEQDEGPEGS